MKKWLFYFSILGFPGSLIAQIGNPAPDFTATDVHGHTHHLYEYLEQGKVVVLDFFFTTCGPCQFYSPQVNLAYEKYGCNTADVLFIAIDYGDTDAMVEAYDATFNIKYPSISGVEGGGNAIVSSYGVIGFPTFYVIDSTKTIIDEIDPPTLQVFDFRFEQHGILPADCGPSGIEDPGEDRGLHLYPNPVTDGFLTIEWPGGLLKIYDVAGQLVFEKAFKVENHPAELDISWLPPGMYWLKGERNPAIKLIKM